MTAHTITTRLALLLSLLALGALGLIACGGGDDEDSATEAKAPPDTTTEATAPRDTTTEAKLSREQVQELKAKPSRLSREQVQELKREANIKAKLSREQVQELKREANAWASLFAVRACNKYMGQPICERLDCVRHVVNPTENCTPVSAAFRKSFADATIEDIKSERIVLVGWTDRPLYEAAVKFSNGVAVVFDGFAPPGAPEPPDGSCAGAGPEESCSWNIAEVDVNRRFVEAATTPP
jgi:hypothetical protein